MLKSLLDAWRRRSDAREMADIHGRIERFGWTAIYVGDYHSAPTWAYTIGFRSSLGAPEIVVFDLPQTAANNIFHEVYEDLRLKGLVIRDGEPWRPEMTEHPAVWRKVHPSQLQNGETLWLGLAETFGLMLAPEQEFEAFQLVLSDGEGRLPWEPGYDERLRALQVALWEPREGSS